MANFGGYTVETPQDVLKRIRLERTQLTLSRNPLAIQRALFGEAFDNMFGNPEVRKAQQLQDTITAVDGKFQPDENADDLTNQMNRLKAIRDSVADQSPETAAQINTQLLAMGQQRMERMKLQQEMTLAQNRDTRENAQATREEQLHPFELMKDQLELLQKQNEGQNWMNPANGKTVNLPKLDAASADQLRKQGWVEVDNPKVQGSKEDVTGITKPTRTDLEGKILEGQGIIDQFAQLGDSFDPKFLTLPNQAWQGTKNYIEKLGGKLSPADKADLEKFSEFKGNINDLFNSYIKTLAGTAVSKAEEGRTRKGFPNDDDGPTQFQGKTRATLKKFMQFDARARQALQLGIKDPETIGKMPLPDVDESKVDAIMNKIFKPKASGQKPGMSARERLDRALKQ